MDNFDKDLESAANKMINKKISKGKDGKYITAKEPQDAMGWLKKAYIDNDPADGAPKVGDMGYV